MHQFASVTRDTRIGTWNWSEEIAGGVSPKGENWGKLPKKGKSQGEI